jgi:hypothetical protein
LHIEPGKSFLAGGDYKPEFTERMSREEYEGLKVE